MSSQATLRNVLNKQQRELRRKSKASKASNKSRRLAIDKLGAAVADAAVARLG